MEQEAVRMLKRGIAANPVSYLLTFAYAEIEEKLNNFQEVHLTYKRFIARLKKELEDLPANPMRLACYSSVDIVDSMQRTPSDSVIDPSNPPVLHQVGESNTLSAAEVASPTSIEISQDVPAIAHRRQELDIAWIQYMRFARRAEGNESFQKVFSDARADGKWATWKVFEAAGTSFRWLDFFFRFARATRGHLSFSRTDTFWTALTQYHCNRDTNSAKQIFQKAIVRFPHELSLIDAFLAFLLDVNDEMSLGPFRLLTGRTDAHHANARALFEAAAPFAVGSKGRALWERWGRYIYEFLSLEDALTFDARFAAAFKGGASTLPRFGVSRASLTSERCSIGHQALCRPSQVRNARYHRIAGPWHGDTNEGYT